MRNFLIPVTFSLLIFFLLLSPPLYSQDSDATWDNYTNDLSKSFSSGNLKEALKIAYQRKSYIEQIPHKDPRLGVAYTEIGLILLKQKLYDSALVSLNHSLSVFLDYYQKENYNTASSRYLLGFCNYKLNKLREAETQALKAEKIFDQINLRNEESVIKNYINLSDIYFKLSNFDNAIVYSNKAINRTKEENGDKDPSLATLYNELGYLEFSNQNYSKAKNSLDLALSLATKNHNHKEIGFSMNYLGLTYSSIKEYKKAIAYFIGSKEALSKSNLSSIDKTANLISINTELGTNYSAINKMDSATYYLTLADYLSKDVTGISPLILASKSQELGKLYENQKKIFHS